MRPVLTTLVIITMVTGLGAAPRPRKSDANTKASSTTRLHRSKAHQDQDKHKSYQVGRASWYGKHFHGKKTASGEPYDMFQFTAAHQRLPLGTMVRVTNLRNQRWVIVRVNDRGPVPKSRIIDLSYGAAQILGLRAGGVERVRLDVVQPDEIASAETEIAAAQ